MITTLLPTLTSFLILIQGGRAAVYLSSSLTNFPGLQQLVEAANGSPAGGKHGTVMVGKGGRTISHATASTSDKSVQSDIVNTQIYNLLNQTENGLQISNVSQFVQLLEECRRV